MDKYSVKERTAIVKFYYGSQKSIVRTQAKYRDHFNVETAPSESIIRNLITCFQKQGDVFVQPQSNEEDVDDVQQDVEGTTMGDVEVKRKGRPRKTVAPEVVEPPTKKEAVVSNGDDAATPAKRGRGRPPKAHKVIKKAPIPGRGRGRPPKNNASKNKIKEKESEEEEEEDEEEEDEKKESEEDSS